MTRREKKELLLDKTVTRWKELSAQGEDAAAEACREQMWILSFELYDKKFEDESRSNGNESTNKGRKELDPTIFMDAFEEAYRSYDVERGPFSHYLSFLLKRREIDRSRYAERHAPRADMTWDEPIGEEGSLTLDEVIPGGESTPEERLLVDELFGDLAALVLDFARNHKGHQANEKRQMWYRVFYTEDMTLTYKKSTVRFSHERDIFRAMLLDYLDSYMATRCRTGEQISFTPLKPYGEVVPARQGKTGETPVPLPADVSLEWLRRNGIPGGASARSNQLRSYEAEKRELMQSLC